MQKQITKKLFLCVLITCFIVSGSLPLCSKPHEELTYEPIQFNPPSSREANAVKRHDTLST